MKSAQALTIVCRVGVLLLITLSCDHLDAEKLYFSSYLDIPYQVAEHSDPTQTSLDVHVPKHATNAPVLFFVHGGSWAFGDKYLYNSNKLPFLVSLGFVVVSTNYRLSSDEIRHPSHVNDVAKALAWIVGNIGKYGGDPGGIYLMGHSAGAHLVSLLTLSDEFLANAGLDQSNIRGVVLVDTAAFDMVKTMENLKNTPSSFFHDAFGGNIDTWIHASPMHQIQDNKRYPPFLILVASPVLMPIADQLRIVRERKWQTVAEFCEKLRRTGTTVYTVDAMQYKSHRSIDEDLGNTKDLPTLVVQEFLAYSEAVRKRHELPSEPNANTVFRVEGSDWQTASRRLGDYTADVVIRFRDRNGDKLIERSELQGQEVAYFEGWDIDSNGTISKKDIIQGYEQLEPN